MLLAFSSTYAAFTHTDFTTRYRTENLYKIIFVLSRPRDIIVYEAVRKPS